MCVKPFLTQKDERLLYKMFRSSTHELIAHFKFSLKIIWLKFLPSSCNLFKKLQYTSALNNFYVNVKFKFFLRRNLKKTLKESFNLTFNRKTKFIKYLGNNWLTYQEIFLVLWIISLPLKRLMTIRFLVGIRIPAKKESERNDNAVDYQYYFNNHKTGKYFIFNYNLWNNLK